MAMPAIVEITDEKDQKETSDHIEEVFRYFNKINETFSPFKETSEIFKLNEKKISTSQLSSEVKHILKLAAETHKLSGGYFDIVYKGHLDPSGIVKGWAINNGAEILKNHGYENYYVEIAGDIQTSGHHKEDNFWKIGIRNPLKTSEIVKVVNLKGQGIATSGTYMQGVHIYDPVNRKKANELLALTVIGPNVYEADRFATAAFAMGKAGINFIASRPGLAGYAIDHEGVATYTTDFEKYVANN